MAINPIVYTEKVTRSFLRYQLTAYRFADPRLHTQMRHLLSLDATRNSPLFRGPYVSLSRSFQRGVPVGSLVSDGILHPLIGGRTPAGMTHVYGHQEKAMRAIHAKKTTIISTGTGSGKTECFLYPIVSRCLWLKDADAPPGISAVIVYPMNALAEDQLRRLRSLLAGTRIPFGMYVGKTPDSEAEVTGVRLPEGASSADYEATLAEVEREKRSETVHPPEEHCSREVMRKSPPRILLTNIKQLELLLTRQQDAGLFTNALLDFLVFDEAHTFTGVVGAETACLIRRLRNFCRRHESETVCIATSATIVNRDNPETAKEFAARFFGVSEEKVTTVSESFDSETWQEGGTLPSAPTCNLQSLLQECVQIVDLEDSISRDTGIRKVYEDLSGETLGTGLVPEALYTSLSRNEILYWANIMLAKPKDLNDLCAAVTDKVGRVVTEEEMLAWLTLGTVARSEKRPLLRPVVHGFIRGIGGAFVSFPENSKDPKLSLSISENQDVQGPRTDDGEYARFPVTTCTTCGQHYFIAYLRDFQFTAQKFGGGNAKPEGNCWDPQEETRGAGRVVLIDQLHRAVDDTEVRGHNHTLPLYFCRVCRAAHPDLTSRCRHCGKSGEMIVLHAIRQKKDNPGYLASCISCGANGRKDGARYREPARPVRAINVADVHVLAQDMIQHAERPRLLIFCDNRQDAAFQAGWMKDHARRFRFRALMAEQLEKSSLSVGDLTHRLNHLLAADDALSRALTPEVWRAIRWEASGKQHEKERLKFLRIQVLRELTTASRQALGLEPWGRMRVRYDGLIPSNRWIVDHANKLGIPPESFREGMACVLDYLRRQKVLYDAEHEIFSRYFEKGSHEIQRGYLPLERGPKGTKLAYGENEKKELIISWQGVGGRTTAIRQMVGKWGVRSDDVPGFLLDLFKYLAQDLKLLKPVTLKGWRRKPLPGVSGLYQVDADRLILCPARGYWRCGNCSRVISRRPPHKKCPAWRCRGELKYFSENKDTDDYNLSLLDGRYRMLRPEEHTAMVPAQRREELENYFKRQGDAVNCFACTPTLEIGIDIGMLDAILMRNMPPLPMNYWQRVGRAGRRHRMAVNLTYCRSVSHDLAYFSDPIKMLTGHVEPPSFNLRNELMVKKHVHATILTLLHQIGRDLSTPDSERSKIESVLDDCFPAHVSHYLFVNGEVRRGDFDLTKFGLLVAHYRECLTTNIRAVFSDTWPTADMTVVSFDELDGHINSMVGDLSRIVRRLKRRLEWAMRQMRRLDTVRTKQGTLEPADDALYKSCDRLIKRLKGKHHKSRREAEGYEDTHTLSVLAAEGFLPGYGLEIGSVRGDAEIPSWEIGGELHFSLPRPPGTALREYVPGNLIYANGIRFVPRCFHFDIDEKARDVASFQVSTSSQAVQEIQTTEIITSGESDFLSTKSICDVDLVHHAYISDEEEFRFQMSSSIYGYERGSHSGGKAWHWGDQSLQHRKAVSMRLVNVGPAYTIDKSETLGFLVCQVCGMSCSPFASSAEVAKFVDGHKERCGQEVVRIGFHSDMFADTIKLPECESRVVAYSVLEILRFAAARVLDMHLEDLQVLVIGRIGSEDVDAVLWDTMPGGSGLLDQICARFPEIVDVAKEVAAKCPSGCKSSCVDCLRTFRNIFYHRYLNRNAALKKIEEWGMTLTDERDIPPQQGAVGSGGEVLPVNVAETKLKELLRKAGFGSGVRGEQICLDRAIGTTTPDVIYRADFHGENEGVCIYLDGMSAHIHGNPETMEVDRRIRDWLRNHSDYDVIVITVSDLSDKKAMERHFKRLARYLKEDERWKGVTGTPWFR